LKNNLAKLANSSKEFSDSSPSSSIVIPGASSWKVTGFWSSVIQDLTPENWDCRQWYSWPHNSLQYFLVLESNCICDFTAKVTGTSADAARYRDRSANPLVSKL
jgi:hypothetical protein